MASRPCRCRHMPTPATRRGHGQRRQEDREVRQVLPEQGGREVDADARGQGDEQFAGEAQPGHRALARGRLEVGAVEVVGPDDRDGAGGGVRVDLGRGRRGRPRTVRRDAIRSRAEEARPADRRSRGGASVSEPGRRGPRGSARTGSVRTGGERRACGRAGGPGSPRWRARAPPAASAGARPPPPGPPRSGPSAPAPAASRATVGCSGPSTPRRPVARCGRRSRSCAGRSRRCSSGRRPLRRAAGGCAVSSGSSQLRRRLARLARSMPASRRISASDRPPVSGFQSGSAITLLPTSPACAG